MFCNLSTTARISKRVDGGVAGRRVTVAAKLLQRQHSDKHNNNNKTNATPMQTFLDTSLNSFACARNAKHKRVTETEREGEQESEGEGAVERYLVSGTAATRSLSSAKMSPHAIKNVAKITQQTERCSNEACAGLRVSVCVCMSVAGVCVTCVCMWVLCMMWVA